MGLFSWIREKVERAVEAVKDFFGLGSRGSYSGSVQETVDIDKVLNDFRDSISPKAEQREKEYMNIVLKKFDDFIESRRYDYPELVSALAKKRNDVKSKLSGIIIDHINKRASVNDDEFRGILEMQPGDSKKEKLEKQSQKFLLEAETLFEKNLQSEMDKLNKELSERFSEALEEQDKQLKKREADYQTLLGKAERGQLDLKDLEDKCIFAADANSCMACLFDQVECEK